jgi:hypothetical protein
MRFEAFSFGSIRIDGVTHEYARVARNLRGAANGGVAAADVAPWRLGTAILSEKHSSMPLVSTAWLREAVRCYA